jgi:hypothetical protein
MLSQAADPHGSDMAGCRKLIPAPYPGIQDPHNFRGTRHAARGTRHAA